MQSSRKGGTRDPQMLLDNLHLKAKPAEPVVLFDDVLTTGAHLIACYRKLATAGIQPVRALALGRATREQQTKMIGWTDHYVAVEEESSVWDFDF